MFVYCFLKNIFQIFYNERFIFRVGVSFFHVALKECQRVKVFLASFKSTFTKRLLNSSAMLALSRIPMIILVMLPMIVLPMIILDGMEDLLILNLASRIQHFEF